MITSVLQQLTSSGKKNSIQIEIAAKGNAAFQMAATNQMKMTLMDYWPITGQLANSRSMAKIPNNDEKLMEMLKKIPKES